MLWRCESNVQPVGYHEHDSATAMDQDVGYVFHTKKGPFPPKSNMLLVWLGYFCRCHDIHGIPWNDVIRAVFVAREMDLWWWWWKTNVILVEGTNI